MADQVKIEAVELQKINDLRSAYDKKTTELGQIAVSKLMMEQQIKNINSIEDRTKKEYLEIQSKEQELLKELNAKYGQGSLDIATGIFTPTSVLAPAPTVQ